MEVKKYKGKFWAKKSTRIIAALLTTTVVAALLGGWLLFTGSSTYQVGEAVELEAWNGSEWVSLELNSADPILWGYAYDEGGNAITMSPGETQTQYLRMRNTAASGILGGRVEMGTNENLVREVVCKEGSAANYEVTDSNIFVKLPSGSEWQTIGIKTIAPADMQPAGTITLLDKVLRDEAISNYTMTCPT